MKKQRILLTGATGMIGGLVLRQCLDRREVATVTSVGRRPCGVESERLTEVIHANFADLGPASAAFEDQDVALFCLGAYTGSVSDEQLKQATVDYLVEFARRLHQHSPDASFCLLSGQGADRTETSRIAFARYKGAAENVVLELGFPRTFIFRPGYIYPVTPRREPNLSYRIFRSLFPVMRRLYPNIGVTSEQLAGLMVELALGPRTQQPLGPILENRDIRRLSQGNRS